VTFNEDFMTEDYLVLAQIAYDLQDASEELSKLKEMFSPNVKIDENEFRVNMARLYAHLNSAWNIRNLNGKVLESTDKTTRIHWKKFPKDIDPL